MEANRCEVGLSSCEWGRGVFLIERPFKSSTFTLTTPDAKKLRDALNQFISQQPDPNQIIESLTV